MNGLLLARKLRNAVAVFAAVILLNACGADISPQERFQRAQELLNKGDYRAATLEYKLILQKEPENIAARWALGQAYLELGDGLSAEKELKFALSKGKTGDEVAIPLARAHLLRNDYKKALEALDQGKNQQNSPLAWVLRGEAALGLQDIATAQQSFLEGLRTDAKNPLAHRGLAKVALINKDFEEANSRLNLALAESSQDPQSWTLKGEVALATRKTAKAEEYFSKAVGLDDNSFSARVGLVRALLEQNKTAQAKEEIAFLSETLPDHPLVNYLTAVAAKQSNELPAAKEALQRVRSVLPEHLPSKLLLGSIHYLLKEYELAAHELNRYIAADPDHLSARKLLAAAELKLKAPDRVIEVLEPIEARAPEDVPLLSLLGNAHIAKGNHSLGMAYLERAAALAPEATELRLRLADRQLVQGNPDKAIAELNSAIEMDPDFLQAELMLGLIHLRRGDYNQALESAQRMLAKQPDIPLPYNLMGAAYEGKKELVKARDNYEKAITVAANYTPAMLNLARLDLQAQDPASARRHYDTVLKIDLHNVKALLGLAKIAKDEKRLDDARQLLDRARTHNADAVQPRLILTEVYLRENQTKKALEAITEAANLAPDNTRVLLLLGQSQLTAGDLKAGQETFEKLVKLHPRSAEAHFRLALAQLAGKDTINAKKSLQQAITSDETYLPARIALGNLELQAGNTQGATRIAQALQKERPKTAAGYALHGDILMRRGHSAEAVKAYKNAYTLSPTRPLLLKLFHAEETTGNHPQANERLRRWIATYPQDIAVHLLLAQTLHKNGQTAGATTEYEDILKLQRNNIVALNNLANLYLGSNPTKALELAKQAYDLAGARPDILDTYGWVLVKTGDPQRGLRILKSAALDAPDNRNIQFHLAAARAQTGELKQAKNDLQAMIADGKPFTERAAAVALLKELQQQ